ncbi:MAG: hypothetical protein KAS12_03255 [Candidatus Aenigmarchaeota archaeon]|nr:hypothetical protein [Candidatus Aenigmarchaeota archaeon]
MITKTLSSYIKENQHLLTTFGLFAALTVYFTDFVIKSKNTEIIYTYIPFITLILMIIVGMELYLNALKNNENELIVKGLFLETLQTYTKTSFILALFFLVVIIFLYILITYTQPVINLLNFSLFFITTMFIFLFNDKKKINEKINNILNKKKYAKYSIFLLGFIIFLYLRNIVSDIYPNLLSTISNYHTSILTGIFFYFILMIIIILTNSLILILGDIKKYLSNLYSKTVKK